MRFNFPEPVRKAAPRKRKTKLSRVYDRTVRLSRHMERTVQLNLVKGIKTFRKRVSAERLRTAWEYGNYEDVMRIIPWAELPKATEKVGPDLMELLITAGQFALTAIPIPENREIRFDLENPKLTGYIDRRAGELVTNIQGDTQKIIQNAIARSFSDAQTPRDVADSILGSIGLLPRQEQALRTYSANLLYKGLPAENVQKYSAEYADRLLDQRAMMIARTETRFATNYGQLYIWKDAQNQGILSENAKKVWIVDGNPCEICEPMDGEEVGLAEAWVLNDGSVVDIPTESHPNCYCGMEINMADTEEKTEANTPEESASDDIEE